MKPSDNLWRLIKSMSAFEKRHFSIHSDRYKKRDNQSDKNYLVLFEVLDKMKEYNHETLEKALKDEKWIGNLSSEKIHLFDVLEECLIELGHDKTGTGKLRRLVEGAELLRERKLYEKCRERLLSAKKLAVKLENYLILIQINQLERSLVREHIVDGPLEILKSLKQEETEYYERLHQIHRIKAECDLLGTRARKSLNALTVEEEREYRNLMDDLLGALNETPLSFEAGRLQLSAKAFIMTLLKDKKAEYKYQFSLVQLWESHPAIQKELQKNYKIALMNFLSSCHGIGNYGMFPDILMKMKGFPPKTEDEVGEDFQGVYFFEFLWKINTHQWEDALEMIQGILDGIELHGEKVNTARKIAFFTNIMLLFFITENHEEARRWTLKIQDEFSGDHREDLQHLMILFQAVLEYEIFSNEGKNSNLKNMSPASIDARMDQVEKTIKALYQKLLRRRKLNELESLLFSALKSLVLMESEADRIAIFRKLAENIDKLKSRKGEHSFPCIEEFNAWAVSKINGSRVLAEFPPLALTR